MASEIQCRACAHFNRQEFCSKCIELDQFQPKPQPFAAKTEYQPVSNSRIPAGPQKG